jgi:hypothetical protein
VQRAAPLVPETLFFSEIIGVSTLIRAILITIFSGLAYLWVMFRPAEEPV